MCISEFFEYTKFGKTSNFFRYVLFILCELNMETDEFQVEQYDKVGLTAMKPFILPYIACLPACLTPFILLNRVSTVFAIRNELSLLPFRCRCHYFDLFKQLNYNNIEIL